MSDKVISFPGYLRDGLAVLHACKRHESTAAMIETLPAAALDRIVRWEYRRFGKELVARLRRIGGNAA
jgi:uncharacterized protein (DUF2384 family)